jgi:DNA-binding NarL/FixJ family response regulator
MELRHRPIRVLIVDDHELARAGLRALLSNSARLEIVGEAADGQEAFRQVRRLRPDLALMDVRMPGMDGLTATRLIKEAEPQTVVLLFTLHEEPHYLMEAMQAGAAGYLLKGSTRDELLRAIQDVMKGESVVPAALAAQVLKRLGERAPAEEAPSLTGLTGRETEVLALLAQGKTNPQITEVLGVSLGTVKAHVEHIIRKLNVSDRTQAAVVGVQLGLINREEAE